LIASGFTNTRFPLIIRVQLVWDGLNPIFGEKNKFFWTFFYSSRLKINTLLTTTFDPPKRPSIWIAADSEWRTAAAEAPPLAARLHVDVSCLSWASSGIYGVRFLGAIGGYFLMCRCTTGPAREGSVGPTTSRLCLFVCLLL